MSRPLKPTTEPKLPEPTEVATPAASVGIDIKADMPEGHVKVTTTGPFMLVDIVTGAEINPGVENTVPDSSFIRDRIDLGQLELVK